MYVPKRILNKIEKEGRGNIVNIYDMQVGRKYLVGDSYGYDEVTCIEVTEEDKKHFAENGVRAPLVKVRYENGLTDIYFEEPDCGSSTYVEPR